MGYNYAGITRVRHIIDILYYDIGIHQIETLIKRKLNWKVAVHYGCHLIKPTSLRPFDGECEKPDFFDQIVETTGCHSIDYEFKMQCCGAGGGIRTSMKKASLEFLMDKLRQIRKAGADCIVVACPFCHLQFDLGQLEGRVLLKKDEEPFEIPVFYITQLLGLAMGLESKELGLIKPKTLSGITPFISQEKLIDKLASKKD
jgi:heterodisulfide reductase subunit B